MMIADCDFDWLWCNDDLWLIMKMIFMMTVNSIITYVSCFFLVQGVISAVEIYFISLE